VGAVPVRRIGTTGGEAIRVGDREAPLAQLREAHEGFFPELMRGEPTVA
jgi:phosphoribosylformylglycinamidine synthase subunit PurL